MARRQDPFTSLEKELESFFDGWGYSNLARQGYVPSVDVQESEKTVQIHADLPGVDEKNLQIQLSEDGQFLTIRGEKKHEEKKEEAGYTRWERSSGSFERQVALPVSVSQEGAEAVLKNGVLSLTLHKQSPQTAKLIEVRSE